MKRAVVSLLCLLGATSAGAQTPGAAVAPPDTAVARFTWAGDGPTPSALGVFPAEALFGQRVVVMLDHPPGVDPPPLDSLRVDVPWLEPAPAAAAAELPLPPPEGARQVAHFRIYREGPWRAAWQGGAASPVQRVAGRVDDPESVEPVRDPREIGGLPRWLVWLLAGALLVLLAWLARWRWRRRRRHAPAHRGLPPPAWLEAARRLEELERRSLLARDHLDALAGIVRRYLRGRFLLPAEEMTADEVLHAARAAGWPAPTLAPFARLLATCDEARYAPEHVGSALLQRCVRETVDLIDAVRVMPRWTPVPPGELAGAQVAWRRLRELYPPTPDPSARGRAC